MLHKNTQYVHLEQVHKHSYKKKEIELIKDYFKLKKEDNKNYDSAKAKFLNAKEN